MDLIQTSSRQAEPPTVPVDELEHDPHGVFRHYRRLVPFIKRSDGAALVLRNKDVQQFLVNSRTRQAETEFAELRGIEDGVLFDFFKYSMLTSNGSDHRRRRAGFSTAFAFRVMAALQPHIRKVADDLIDEWYAEGEIDFLDRYASQIPARIIGHILRCRRRTSRSSPGWSTPRPVCSALGRPKTFRRSSMPPASCSTMSSGLPPPGERRPETGFRSLPCGRRSGRRNVAARS